jgi:hypothetical protein
LRLKYDELLSSFAFNFSVRRYAEGWTAVMYNGRAVQVDSIKTRVVESAAWFQRLIL